MNMCSNIASNTNNACECCSGVTMWNSGLKKQQQKRPRIPKRGPGVAELEKILREQDTIYPPKPQPQSMPRPNSSNSQGPIPPAPKFDHIVLPRPPTVGFGSIHANNNNSHLGRNGGGGSCMNLISCKNLNEVLDYASQSDYGNSPSRNLSCECNLVWSGQKRNQQSMMNQFHGSGSTLDSSESLSIELQNHLEPHSNQNSYCNCMSRPQDEHHKMVGIKRSHSSSMDNSLIPPSSFQVPPSLSRYNRPQQSSTNESHREVNWGNTLELSNKRFNSENVGSSHANFPPFLAPEVPPPSMNLFNRKVFQDKMEKPFNQSESSEHDHIPFFNFLKVKGQEGVTDAKSDSNEEGFKDGEGHIDLSLKL